MAKRGNQSSSVKRAADGNADTAVLDRVDGNDGQGDEIDTVDLEDAQARAALNLDDDNDDSDPQDALPKGGRPPHVIDPRIALAKAYDARRKGETVEDDETDAEDGDQEQDGDAADGEVVIIGRDGKSVIEAAGGSEMPGDETDPDTTTTQQTTRQAGDATSGPADETPVVMIVDGAKVQTTLGEMRKLAQMSVAAESRLREADRILDNARETAARTVDPDRQDQVERAPVETRQTSRADPARPQIDSAKYVSLVQRIQLGDDPDAASALVEGVVNIVMETLKANGQTSTVSVDQVRSVVEQSRAEDSAKAEISEALNTIASDHKDIVSNRLYWPAAATLARDMAVEALRKIGVPEEDFRQPAEAIFKGYAELRQNPLYREKLQPMKDVWVGAANEIRKEAKLPPRREAPQPGAGDQPRLRAGADQGQSRVVRTSEDRSGRKGRVVDQPRSGSVRTDYTGAGAPPAKTPASDTIANIARGRGQNVGAAQ